MKHLVNTYCNGGGCQTLCLTSYQIKPSGEALESRNDPHANNHSRTWVIFVNYAPACARISDDCTHISDACGALGSLFISQQQFTCWLESACLQQQQVDLQERLLSYNTVRDSIRNSKYSSIFFSTMVREMLGIWDYNWILAAMAAVKRNGPAKYTQDTFIVLFLWIICGSATSTRKA